MLQNKKTNTKREIRETPADPYLWLENINAPKAKKWSKRQEKYARSILSVLPARFFIKKRLKKLFAAGSIGAPIPKKNRFFFAERKEKDELKILYVQDGVNGTPRALVNPNKMPKNKAGVLRDWHPSQNGKMLAYSLSKLANDQGNIRVINADTGETLKDCVPAEFYPALYSPIIWEINNQGFWYSRRDINCPAGEEKFHQKIYYHKLGDDFKKDALVFGGGLNKEDLPSITASIDGRYLLATVYKFSDEKEKIELYLYDSQNPKKGFIPIISKINALFFGEFHQNSLYILTNNRAPFWKLISIDLNSVQNKKIRRRVVIPENKYRIEKFKIIGDFIFVEILKNAHSCLQQYKLNGEFVADIALPTIGTITSLSGEGDGKELFFGFTSFLKPHTIYRFNIQKKKLRIFKKINKNFDDKSFITTQHWFISKDGTKIPLFLIRRKNIKLKNNNPAVLYGYGGFCVAITPFFSESIIPFLEQGGIYAVANIRGGGEFGEQWHKIGRREKKLDSINDFISAANWLISQKYTNNDKIAATGWSNGGLTVGAAITKQPKLFKAAIIGAPVLDMLRYHLFYGGRQWIPEYGNPEKKSMRKKLLTYSPYHNIKIGENYPATMILTAENDDRVHPAHAYKMTARIQNANRSNNPIILRIEKKSGHEGAVSQRQIIKQEIDIWSFLFKQLGIKINSKKRR